MLNEEKIKVMNKLAMYEQGKGKKHLPISKFYRSDYVGRALIQNFFLVTIGYMLILAGLAAYNGNFLMENMHRIDLILLGKYLIAGYGIALVVFSMLTYIQYTVRYYRAKKSVKEYYNDLTTLDKIYENEEKKSSGWGNAGGYKK